MRIITTSPVKQFAVNHQNDISAPISEKDVADTASRKGTNSGQCSENNWKLVIPVWPADFAHLSTQSEVSAMAVTQSSWR